MSSPDGTKVQVNFRAGEDLINVYGQDEADVLVGLTTVQNVAGVIAETGALLRGATAASPLTQPQPVAPAVPTQPAPAAYPQGVPAAPNPQPAAAPQTAGHACLHGQRVFKSGNGAKGPWAAWFCPTDKNDPNKCEAEWVKV